MFSVFLVLECSKFQFNREVQKALYLIFIRYHTRPHTYTYTYTYINMIGGVIGALTPGGEPVEIEARASIGG